jgi:hypothetical protein
VVHASDKDDDCSDKTCGGVEVKEIAVKPRQRISPPFIPSHDIPRGIIYMFQAALAYALMLAVMYVCHSSVCICCQTLEQDVQCCICHIHHFGLRDWRRAFWTDWGARFGIDETNVVS